MSKLTLILWEIGHTARSLLGASRDWLVLHTGNRPCGGKPTFAFLVHPRTDDFVGQDVYGGNDIYRPFPAFRHLFKVMPDAWAESSIRWFARWVAPITLSKISVATTAGPVQGYLLTTVRTPTILLKIAINETRDHLAALYRLAGKKGVHRVGLGALLPSMTQYGKRFVGEEISRRPAVSTGHAYTAYTIVEFLRVSIGCRHTDTRTVTVAIAGAAGSTGKATLRMLKRRWNASQRLNLLLVDLPKNALKLRQLENELRSGNAFGDVRTATDLFALNDADYVVVVTNDQRAIIGPEHVRSGTVLIDDSQPRNTGPELLKHGCAVIDVLARVPGLDCHFDFGFQTDDKTVTFTCLAETVLTTASGEIDDLAVGEVTDSIVDRMLKIVEKGKLLGLVGPLPFFSFGRELDTDEREALLRPQTKILVPAAE